MRACQLRDVGLAAAAVILLATGLLIGCGDARTPAVSDLSAEPSEPVESGESAAVAADGSVDGGAASGGTVNLPPDGRPELLSEWGQLELADGQLRPASGVTAYSLNSALFSDYAQKLRTVWLPAGAAGAGYQDEAVFDFPVGTVITKTFWYPLASGDDPQRVQRAPADISDLDGIKLSSSRLLETRVLVHRAEGWEALPYVWNEDQTEAVLQRTGDLLRLTMVGDPASADETDFVYLVPNVNQCASCHTSNHTTGEIAPIGPKARHLNREIDLGGSNGPQSQLAFWLEQGLVMALPDVDDIPRAAVWNDGTASLNDRTRAYLDINCAHCHNRNGPADTSGLFLEAGADLGARFGVCKPPIAAGTGTGGRRVSIHPGQPEDSIFVFRMETTDPASMMPEVGRALSHTEGVDLVSEWIGSLEGVC